MPNARPNARHPNARKIPEGALTKDEARAFLGVARQTLDYYIRNNIIKTFKAGKYRYCTLSSCQALKDLNSACVEKGGEKWLTIKEAAELTGISVSRLLIKCRNGEFESAKGLNRVYVNPESVQAYLDRFKSVNGRETLTAREAAEIYGCSLETMRAHAYGDDSLLETVVVGNRRLIYKDSLMDFIRKRDRLKGKKRKKKRGNGLWYDENFKHKKRKRKPQEEPEPAAEDINGILEQLKQYDE